MAAVPATSVPTNAAALATTASLAAASTATLRPRKGAKLKAEATRLLSAARVVKARKEWESLALRLQAEAEQVGGGIGRGVGPRR